MEKDTEKKKPFWPKVILVIVVAAVTYAGILKVLDLLSSFDPKSTHNPVQKRDL